MRAYQFHDLASDLGATDANEGARQVETLRSGHEVHHEGRAFLPHAGRTGGRDSGKKTRRALPARRTWPAAGWRRRGWFPSRISGFAETLCRASRPAFPGSVLAFSAACGFGCRHIYLSGSGACPIAVVGRSQRPHKNVINDFHGAYAPARPKCRRHEVGNSIEPCRPNAGQALSSLNKSIIRRTHGKESLWLSSTCRQPEIERTRGCATGRRRERRSPPARQPRSSSLRPRRLMATLRP